jgi:putative FmdB family regulatory protein
MPIYKYECTKCGERFELRRNMADSDSNVKCPKCSRYSPKRVVSIFSSSSGSISCAPSAPSGST